MFRAPAARVAARFPEGDPYSGNFESAFVVEDAGGINHKAAQNQANVTSHRTQAVQSPAVQNSGDWALLASEVASRVATQVAQQVATTTAQYAAHTAVQELQQCLKNASQKYAQRQEARRETQHESALATRPHTPSASADEEDKLFKRMMMLSMMNKHVAGGSQLDGVVRAAPTPTSSINSADRSNFEKWMLVLCVTMVVVGIILAVCAIIVAFRQQQPKSVVHGVQPQGQVQQAHSAFETAAMYPSAYDPYHAHRHYVHPYYYYPPHAIPGFGLAAPCYQHYQNYRDCDSHAVHQSIRPCNHTDATWAQEVLDEANAVLQRPVATVAMDQSEFTS